MIKVILIIAGVLIALFVLLFVVYFFNLDMKLTVNVIAPFLEKIYDKRKRDQHL